MNIKPMPLIVGPCVIEDEGLVREVAQELKRQLEGEAVDFYFKASFDKANRTSMESFRGPGLKAGLEILNQVRAKTGVKLCTDFHAPEQADSVAEVVDMLQIPAFLCRQTDLVCAGARAAIRFGRKLNIKKGQFLAPWDVKNIVEKVSWVAEQMTAQNTDHWFFISERGTSFGYNTLVVDMISFQCIREFGVPVIFDATHSVQTPGAAGGGKSTGGKRGYIEVLARAAIAAGADGIFMECHPRPEKALSDGPNAFPLEHVRAFVRQLLLLRSTVREFPKLINHQG